jgi:hypothetical protein
LRNGDIRGRCVAFQQQPLVHAVALSALIMAQNAVEIM